jgi:serine phosphatase RsbU (regulator of sigma subunit)/catechol 2,3-dioxygenase-like lactoylglutathione lyase family enzyme
MSPAREINPTPEPPTLQRSSASVRHLIDPASARPSEQSLYLRIFTSTVFVRDHDRSLPFFTEQLGFTIVADARMEFGNRWVAVAPPDGSAILALIAPKRGSENYKRIGCPTQVSFIAQDINATFELWRSRGVEFLSPPQKTLFGGTSAAFADIDGNTYQLLASDELSREIEAQRQALNERLDAERRSAQELEIAKQVQAKLFPQTLPRLKTLDYAGICIQARHVGGDYYDFLDLGRDRLALVVGDIAGKGIAAALLMANLQANLRSQVAIALKAPKRFLASVNRMLFENTTPSAYATLFFAEYDDRTRKLRYANCGHLCALILHPDGKHHNGKPSNDPHLKGKIERLDSNCSVMGLFNDWECAIGKCQLAPGDILALYTDGVTESFDENEEEFGEGRLIEALRRHKKLPAHEMVNAIVNEVQTFTCPERGQYDDITVIVAKCTAE